MDSICSFSYINNIHKCIIHSDNCPFERIRKSQMTISQINSNKFYQFCKRCCDGDKPEICGLCYKQENKYDWDCHILTCRFCVENICGECYEKIGKDECCFCRKSPFELIFYTPWEKKEKKEN